MFLSDNFIINASITYRSISSFNLNAQTPVADYGHIYLASVKLYNNQVKRLEKTDNFL